ncbi:hypothetical protein KQH93_07510 [Coprococcus comes]|nr:hypothetical protein [Coprococcus comes]
MQIYSAIFPVKESLSQDDLINLVIEWNQGSPHNKISNLNWDGKKRNIKFEDGNLSLAIEEIRTYNTIAIRFHQFDENNIIWNTDIVVNFNTHIFSIKIDRETTADTIGFIPQFKTPILVNMLLDGDFIGMDNDLEISAKEIPIKKDNYKVIENIICRNTVYSMPVIYVTKSWGRYPLRVHTLAYRLRGVAHVLIEEDADVCKFLKDSCRGMNSHHGSIGIYYPGSSAPYKIITPRRYEGQEETLIDRIVNMVCRYMNQQARDKMMTWEGVQNELLKLRYVSATEKKAKAENEVSEVYENFSDELEEKERTIEELNNRVMALQAENQGLRAKYEQVSEIPLIYYGEEDELYEGEIKDHILETLQKQMQQVKKGTRKELILQDILESNELTGALEEKRAEIKRILKGYTKVGDSLKRDLKAYGFIITKDGGHYKLTYKGDSRYLFTMASSGSDSQRGGENLIGDIIRDML